MATALSEMKPRQAQINRIRKEEDEENWISGEELNTDGSSDEEGCGRGAQSFSCHEQQAHPSIKCSSHHMDRELLHRTISAPAQFQQVPPPLHGTFERATQLEEQEEIMLWRPKRGSIKLPHHIEHDKKLGSSGRHPQQQKVSG